MLAGILTRWISRLRFPWLLLTGTALFLLNLVIPDPLPMVDEILLAIATAAIASFRRKDDGIEKQDESDPEETTS